MDQLFKGMMGGAIPDMRGMFGGIGAPEGDSQNDNEEIDDEIMMENARVAYDVFIQNSLKSTSHSVQWLPYKLDDNDYPAFTKKYFLLGTHNEDDE